jgi:peptidoglycan/xylan/chitin deacetylase (PgdA/CDA1 family)
MPSIAGVFRRLPPFATSTLIVSILVSWLVFSLHYEKKQTTEVVAAAARPEKVVNKEILPRKDTVTINNALVAPSGNMQRFYLYVSPETTRYYAREGINYENILQHWRNFLEDRKIKVNVVSNFATVRKESGSVVILASALALSDAEKRQLQAFQESGGGILATWGLASRNQGGKFEGYEFIRELFGIRSVREIAGDSPVSFLNIAGDTPLTLGYQSGLRIWLDKLNQKWLSIDGGKPAALYSDWTRNIKPDHADTGIAYGTSGVHNDARWVMLGFPETSWGAQVEDLFELLESSLHWLAHGVAISKPSWPVPYEAAYMVEMDTEEGFENAPRLAQMMESINAPATFYCLTREALRHPEMVRTLDAHHEIAFHGDVHDSFLYQVGAVQSDRMDKMQREMAGILGQTVRSAGFRAPKEEYDQNTERQLAANGFGHHVVDPNRTDARLPFLYHADDGKKSGSELVILPRTQRDDFNLPISSPDKNAEEKLLGALIVDLEASLKMRALGLLSVHSQHFGTKSALADVMPEFLRHLAQKRDRVWITTGGQVAQWWRDRERFMYKVEGHSDKFNLTISVPDKALGKGALILTNAWAGIPPTVRPMQPNVAPPAIRVLDEQRTALVLDGMPAGSYSFEVVAGMPASMK